MPLVSVIITTYNYAQYLPEAIDSVLNQAFTDFEVIVINDGSTDNTNEVMQTYRAHSNIRYITQKNAGQTKAKNSGIRQAQGTYIAFLDADDVWMREKLIKQLHLFGDPTVGIVYSDFIQIDHKGMPFVSFNQLRMHRGNVTDNLFLDNFVCFSSCVVRKECFDNHGLFDETLAMGIDWDRWLEFSKKYRFDFVDEPLVKYRVGHTDQMSKKGRSRRTAADFITKRFVERNPGLISQKTLRLALAYTYRNKGDYYQKVNRFTSISFNVKSLMLNPFQLIPMLRIVKMLLPRFLLEIYSRQRMKKRSR